VTVAEFARVVRLCIVLKAVPDLFTMQTFVLVMLSLACAGQARRVQTEFNPALGFNAGVAPGATQPASVQPAPLVKTSAAHLSVARQGDVSMSDATDAPAPAPQDASAPADEPAPAPAPEASNPFEDIIKKVKEFFSNLR